MVKLNKDQTLDALLLQETQELSLTSKRKAANTNLPRYHKPVCPYVSSTFIDLEDEFKYLHSEIFPSLNKLCIKRGTYFSPLDFRRTAIDNRSSSEYVLKYALDKVVASLPFFMCVIGSQYGPHRLPTSPPLATQSSTVFNSSNETVTIMDENLVAASHDHPWILQDECPLCSMMELEILLSCFSSQNQLPKYCFFYIKECFRAPSSANAETFLELESEYTQERLHNLKRHIVNKGLPVRFFATKQELGQAVFENWSEVILNLFPQPPVDFVPGDEWFTQRWGEQTLIDRLEHKYCKYPQLCELEEKLTKHASSAALHLSNSSTTYSAFNCDEELYSRDTESLAGYKIGDGIFSTTVSFVESLKSHMKNENVEYPSQNIFVLIGDPGSGKTSLLTNWLNKFRKDEPNIVIISEFVGNSHLSQDVTSFLRRCIRTLREKYFETRSTASERLADVLSYEGLVETFASSLYLMPCVIVLDSLNDLRYAVDKDIGSVKTLSWIPKKIPSTCKIILSTRKSDFSYKVLQGRSDVSMQWMPTINLQIREEIFEKHFEGSVVDLMGRDNLEKIWTNRLSDKPLFLATLSDILHSCRNSRDVNQVLDKCTALRIFRDFWKAVCVLWCRRYSWNKNSSGQPGSIRFRSHAAGWVADALKLISMSRCGLSRQEILHLLSLIGYRGRSTVTPNDWEMFLMAAGGALNTGSDGLICITNEDTRLTLRHFLFASIRSSPSRSTANYIEGKHQQFHSILGSYFFKYGSIHRKLVELPWQLQQGKDWLMLCQVLCKPRFFLAMCKASFSNPALYIDHKSYWRDLLKHEFDVSHCLTAMIERSTQEPEVALDSREESDVKIPPAAEESATESKQKQMSNLVAKGPSLIIITQHEDNPLSIHQSTEESCKSETEDGNLVDTESSIFFLTEAEVDHHLLVAGWTPSEDDPEVAIDSTLLEATEVANLYEKVAWFLLQLGDEFSEIGKLAIEETYRHISESRPLISDQHLALFNTAVTECRFGDQVVKKRIEEALEVLKHIPIQTMKLSRIQKRDLVEASAELSLKLVDCYIAEGHFQKAHNLILNVFEETKSLNSVHCKAQATQMFGRLLMSQGLAVQSEEMLTKAFTIFLKWNGKKHLSVGRVLQDLATLFTLYFPRNRTNQRKAMLAYKQAFEVLQFNERPIEAAKVSSLIGQLLLQEGSMRSKKEARLCFEKAIDVYISKQVQDNEEIAHTTRAYRRVSSDLKTGRFAHGKARPPDHRTPERPYSALTWHSNDLAKIGESEEKIEPVFTECKSACSLRRPPSTEIRRPYSAFSTQSVGSYVLVTPRKQSKKRELTSARIVKEASALLTPMDNSKLKEFINQKSEHFDEDLDSSTRPSSRKLTEEFHAMAAVTSVREMRPATSEGKEHPVIIVPGGRNSRMSGKFEEAGEAADHTLMQLPQAADISTRSETGASKRSVRLHATPVVLNPSRKQPTKHRCSYPSGSQYLSLNVHGPHSAVTDVLTTPPSTTRSSGRSTDVHHRSAWFHVPGRYITPGDILPSKRSQFPIRPNSAATTSTKTSSRFIPTSRSLPTSRQGGDRASTYPASIMSAKSRITDVTRRHSEPHLEESVKVVFNTPSKAKLEASQEAAMTR